MNNAQRRAKAAREKMDAVLYVKYRRRGGVNVIPLRYLVPEERADFMRRATSPL